LTFQRAAYSHQLIQHGERLAVLYQRIFEYPLHFAPGPLLTFVNFALASFGIIHSIRRAWRNTNSSRAYRLVLLGTVFCAGPMLLTPFDWERYYMFPIFFTCLFLSIGIAQAIFHVTTFLPRNGLSRSQL
jgi:hypothetical protein